MEFKGVFLLGILVLFSLALAQATEKTISHETPPQEPPEKKARAHEAKRRQRSTTHKGTNGDDDNDKASGTGNRATKVERPAKSKRDGEHLKARYQDLEVDPD